MNLNDSNSLTLMPHTLGLHNYVVVVAVENNVVQNGVVEVADGVINAKSNGENPTMGAFNPGWGTHSRKRIVKIRHRFGGKSGSDHKSTMRECMEENFMHKGKDRLKHLVMEESNAKVRKSRMKMGGYVCSVELVAEVGDT